MLIITENDILQIDVYFSDRENSTVFYDNKEKAPADAKSESFVFRKANWADAKVINSSAVTIDAAGKPTMDLYRYMDQKIKTLLKDWTLKGATNEKLPISVVNINKLNPDLIQHLFSKLEEKSSEPKA